MSTNGNWISTVAMAADYGVTRQAILSRLKRGTGPKHLVLTGARATNTYLVTREDYEAWKSDSRKGAQPAR